MSWIGMPQRYADNRKNGYGKTYGWDWITASEGRVSDAIEKAFNERVSLKDKIKNDRIQMTENDPWLFSRFGETPCNLLISYAQFVPQTFV